MQSNDLIARATPYVPDRAAALDALRLLADYGDGAGAAATREANRSRDLGNLVNFCRWRQVARLIAAMDAANGEQTRH